MSTALVKEQATGQQSAPTNEQAALARKFLWDDVVMLASTTTPLPTNRDDFARMIVDADHRAYEALRSESS